MANNRYIVFMNVLIDKRQPLGVLTSKAAATATPKGISLTENINLVHKIQSSTTPTLQLAQSVSQSSLHQQPNKFTDIGWSVSDDDLFSVFKDI